MDRGVLAEAVTEEQVHFIGAHPRCTELAARGVLLTPFHNMALVTVPHG